jgi:DNA modification methylase
MGGERFNLCASSPPYTDQREYKIGDFDWLSLANGFIDQAFSNAAENADILVNLGMSHKDGRVNRYWDDWLKHCEITHPLYGWYVWDKGEGMPGEWNGRLAPAHEWVFHFSISRKSANKWIKTQGRPEQMPSGRFRDKDGSLRKEYSPELFGQSHKIPDSIIRIYREKKRGIHTQSHPAVFSVEFAEFFIKTWSQDNEIVYEPFSGSGTTIIACENLSRRCRAIEIDPGYVAVTLQRFYDHSGKKPEQIHKG